MPCSSGYVVSCVHVCLHDLRVPGNHAAPVDCLRRSLGGAPVQFRMRLSSFHENRGWEYGAVKVAQGKGARNSQACIKIVRAVSGFRCLLGCLCFIIAAKPDQKPNTRLEIDACFATGHNVATCVPEWVRWVDRGTSAHSVWASGPKQTEEEAMGRFRHRSSCAVSYS